VTAEPCPYFKSVMCALKFMHWRLLAMALNENAAIQTLIFIQQQQTLSRRILYALQ
jgi:hypothetical protein